MNTARVRVGLALEFGSDQFDSGEDRIDFIEYGLQLWRGVPNWVNSMRRRVGPTFHLHPLDVNLAGPERDLATWSRKLARWTADTGATALVTDLGFWYHGRRSSTWERPPLMSTSARVCAARASKVALACGIPFRVENPPVEWMPGNPSIWKYLDEASAAPSVEICLDLSHLLQFERNVHCRGVRLPREFPWERVTELHLAGYVVVEYRRLHRLLDQHVADISDEQMTLAAEVLERRGEGLPLDICLEMEPRSIEAWTSTAARLRRFLCTTTPTPASLPRGSEAVPARVKASIPSEVGHSSIRQSNGPLCRHSRE